jgi:SAM-dependent methyltransferase
MSDHEFLSVNGFLGTEMDARAIKSAIELGILDLLQANDEVLIQTLGASLKINAVGLSLLLEMLEANGVVSRRAEAVALTTHFRAALRFRDLLETRIAFADLVWPDIHTLFTALITDLPQFMARSKVFDLFRYDRCMEMTPENLKAASAWTRFTTVLTKYEAAPVLDLLDLAPAKTFIDMGGNTGEFARQICSRNPQINGVVVDLPVVCALGREHIARSGTASDAARLSFFSTDMRTGALPQAADLVSFKSVLHDWPDAEAGLLMDRAAGLVKPGGLFMIFERAPIAMHGKRVPYVMAADLVFLHFLRPADLYLRKLQQLGFVLLDHRMIELDIGFHFILAQRPRQHRPGSK